MASDASPRRELTSRREYTASRLIAQEDADAGRRRCGYRLSRSSIASASSTVPGPLRTVNACAIDRGV